MRIRLASLTTTCVFVAMVAMLASSGCAPVQSGSATQVGAQPSPQGSLPPSQTADAVFAGYPPSQSTPGELAFIKIGDATFVAHAGGFKDLKGGEAVAVERRGQGSAWVIVAVK